MKSAAQMTQAAQVASTTANNSTLRIEHRLPRKAQSAGRRLNRDSLPSPHRYLEREGLLKQKPKAESALVTCPSHKGGDERHPSMLVSLIDGHYRCMSCGAKGGDIISLHRLRTGKGFADAVKDLGGRFE